MAARSIESQPDQGTDKQMTESLTLTCYLSEILNSLADYLTKIGASQHSTQQN